MENRESILTKIEEILAKEIPNELKAHRIYVDVVLEAVGDERSTWENLLYVDTTSPN